MKFVLDKGYILEQNQINVIQNMLKLNISIEDIAKVVELSKEEVKKIIDTNNLKK